jgi:L-asparaginase II
MPDADRLALCYCVYLHLDQPVSIDEPADLNQGRGWRGLAEEVLRNRSFGVYATPVTALARVYAQLPAIAPRVAAAMRAHPVLIEGKGEPDTVIMQGYLGLISKAGVEGVGCASLPDGRGVAVKVLDGNDRATGPALAALIAQCLGLDDVPAAVVPVARPMVRNDHHDAVGEIVAVLP